MTVSLGLATCQRSLTHMHPLTVQRRPGLGAEDQSTGLCLHRGMSEGSRARLGLLGVGTLRSTDPGDLVNTSVATFLFFSDNILCCSSGCL